MFMKKLENQAYSLMRIFAGFMFLWHGSQKLLNIPAAGFDFPVFIKFVGGPIELFGGLLIMIGLCTRWAAFITSGQMAAAYWMAHGTKSFLPLLNQGEMAALYCFVFLFISARGAGIWSVDKAMARKGQGSTAT